MAPRKLLPAETSPSTMGGRIRKARLDMGMTILELAKIAGLSSPQISNYENDNLEPNTAILRRLADKLNLSLDYLANGKSLLNEDILSGLPGDYRKRALDYIQLLRNDLKLKDISKRVEGLKSNSTSG